MAEGEGVFRSVEARVKEVIKLSGLEEPTPVQRLAIPPISDGKNVLIIAPTGSGKTEAAFLPLIDRILKDGRPEGVNVLYVNPLKALTRDIHRRISEYATLLGLTVRPLYGDTVKSYHKPTPNIIITTPESLEVILDWAPSWWPYLANVRHVVVDEVHDLIDTKRGAQLLILLERLKRLARHAFQRIGLSATVSNPGRVAELLGGSDGALIVIQPLAGREYQLSVSAAIPRSEDEERDVFLAAARRIGELVGDRRTLVFVNSRLSGERLQYALSQLGPRGDLKLPRVAVHHGSISKEEREMIEYEFKRGKLKCVVATKTLELGIDIADIEQVLQYRSPGSVSTLLQRAGRSGHRPGEAAKCTIVSSEPDDLLEALAIVSLAKEGVLDELVLVTKPLDVVAKEITGMALQVWSKTRFMRKRGEAGGEFVDLDAVYSTIIASPLFKDLTKEEFHRVVKALEDNEIISTGSGLKIGRGFWRLWRFRPDERKSRWAKGFQDFFSLIPKRESFTVFDVKDGKIGELDANFVYRSLRTGTVIRLAGRNWAVSEIDEDSMVIRVSETGGGGDVPYWRGEGPSRSDKISRRIGEIARQIVTERKGFDFADDATLAVLRGYLQSQLGQGGKLPSLDTIVVERVPSEHLVFFISLLGEKVNRTLASILAERISKRTLLLSYAVTPYGFLIKAPLDDPVEELLDIGESEVDSLLRSFLEERSPHVRMLELDMADHFGIAGGNVAGSDLLRDEAVRQARQLYFDVDGARKAIAMLKSRELRLDVSIREAPSPIARSMMTWPLERPWSVNLGALLSQLLTEGRSLDDLREYTWEDASKIKDALRVISERKYVIALLEPNAESRLPVKIPRSDGPWGSTEIPCNVRYEIVDDEASLLARMPKLDEAAIVKRLMEKGYSEVEVSVKSTKAKGWLPWSFKINERLPVLLDIFKKQRFEPLGKKIDLKVHIKGSPLYAIYWNAPSLITHTLVLNLVDAMGKISEGLQSKGQLQVELP
jgi:ATP-dependent Lhr-like helicase